MLIHLQPTLLLLVPDETVALISLTIAPYGLQLSGRTDLATRRPHSNKRLWVACRRRGRLASLDHGRMAKAADAFTVSLPRDPA